MKIRKHSCYDSYDIKAIGADYSNIIDKLIRLTAKITEHYASDIIYDIEEYTNAVKKFQEYDVVLGFRDMGVNTYPIHTLDSLMLYQVSEVIQAWRLHYDPEENLTTLYRVDLMEE